METQIFNGQIWAKNKKSELMNRVAELDKKGIKPKLVWIQLGDDEASSLYGRLKGKAAEELGIEFSAKQNRVVEELVRDIKQANEDPKVNGLMVQLPMFREGKRLDDEEQMKVLRLIDPQKDVDCLTPENLGLIMAGSPRFLPATVKAVVNILDIRFMRNDLRGKRVTVVGGGLEVGRPLVSWLSNQGATVLWARSAEQNLGQLTQMADIIISAVGKEGLISGEMVSEGAMVIDVGSPKGDVVFDPPTAGVKEKASFITPVPGGVGPMTVVSLMENVVEAGENLVVD